MCVSHRSQRAVSGADSHAPLGWVPAPLLVTSGRAVGWICSHRGRGAPTCSQGHVADRRDFQAITQKSPQQFRKLTATSLVSQA